MTRIWKLFPNVSHNENHTDGSKNQNDEHMGLAAALSFGIRSAVKVSPSLAQLSPRAEGEETLETSSSE